MLPSDGTPRSRYVEIHAKNAPPGISYADACALVSVTMMGGPKSPSDSAA
ncbi:hypothetical protein PF005_g29187 [Phytophthora fragariae]|uniref:Uncharacterized protein n=1 Tax=Phytophthora fragariae TaxID=53985 RepID=A0A6A4EWD1_9STRA|nr:hypothetical protein PF009_g25121 [Phytophthora fragariae]KAE8962867.1 hypothetical protein PF011_g29230 [Phytophthora fragariae]KAE9060680.1 hypothetical protein PF010_g30121 [Phytophthora fragariae]KAE9062516.1 hypothetical protein PF007_g29880 [Phytophthora fragariae]KAE9068183.1 hypothetical protein PF006_g29844 [Phytophthora fragariae]